MTTTKTLVRADHVGSLLRPATVADARAATLAPDELYSAELAEIEGAREDDSEKTGESEVVSG